MKVGTVGLKVMMTNSRVMCLFCLAASYMSCAMHWCSASSKIKNARFITNQSTSFAQRVSHR
jgi:hypothetical protein